MKTFNYFIALFLFVSVFSFTSCTTNDTEEDQLTITTPDTFATGDNATPPAGRD